VGGRETRRVENDQKEEVFWGGSGATQNVMREEITDEVPTIPDLTRQRGGGTIGNP